MENQEELEFALRFMSEHPQSAVRVLEKSDISAVAGLLTNSPVNYITPALKYMLPEFAVRICAVLEPERAAPVLSTLDANALSIILRLMDADYRSSIMEHLPTTLRTKAGLLLEYASNSVGAWMSPHMLVVANDLKSKNVLKYIKAGSSQDDCEYIYVASRDGIFQGRTRFLDILQAGENLPIASFMDNSCPTIPAQMLLEQASEHRAWEYSDVLPITDSGNRLLGILHHHLLRQGMDQIHAVRHIRATGKDPLSGIFEVYGHSLLALFNTVSEAVPTNQE